MKLLLLSDREYPGYWEYYRQGVFDDVDLILSAGDLKSEYLTFIVTMANKPLIYVHGNHDGWYESHPPEGCECADDRLLTVYGLRILGLGGCPRYNYGPFQYTPPQMAVRARKLRRAVRKAGGVDILLTHAPPAGCGDLPDPAHRGFEIFNELMDRWHPRWLVHGHVHLEYSHGIERVRQRGDTTVINACERYILEIPDPPGFDRSAPPFPAEKKKLFRFFYEE